MAYYDALKTEWATLPSTDTTAQKLAAINALTSAGPNVSVPVSSVVAYLGLNSKLSGLQNYAATAVAGTAGATTQSIVAAKELVALINCPNAPAFAMNEPAAYSTIQGMLAAVVADANSGITAADQTALLALASPTIPWWQANGYSGPLTTGDLVVAGLDTTSGYSVTIAAPTTNQMNITIGVTVTGPNGSNSFSAFAATLNANYSQSFAANCVQNVMTRDAALSTFS